MSASSRRDSLIRSSPELLVQPRSELAVGAQRVVLTAQRVQGQHRGAVRALAEAVQRGGCLGVRQRGGVVELGQRRVGGLQVRAQDASLVGAAKLLRPGGVRLVFQHLAAHQPKRLLQRAPGEVGRLQRRALQQLIEAVQVQSTRSLATR
jgi:hypothetical protein